MTLLFRQRSAPRKPLRTEQIAIVSFPKHATNPELSGRVRGQFRGFRLDLLHPYYDEYLLADELGLDLMLNEHHQTTLHRQPFGAVSQHQASAPAHSRLSDRSLRAAEELATIDVISRGRLDVGFVKGVPYEFAAPNANPVGVMDRFWEAHDYIIKAMTVRDGPFN